STLKEWLGVASFHRCAPRADGLAHELNCWETGWLSTEEYRMKLRLLAALILTVSFVSSARAADGNIIDVLRADGHYTIFLQSLERSGVDQTLRGAGPFLVFAPNDAAFGRVANFSELQKNPETLKAILKNHIVPYSKTQSQDLLALKFATTLQSDEIVFGGG